jgi:hypothetical protein
VGLFELLEFILSSFTFLTTKSPKQIPTAIQIGKTKPGRGCSEVGIGGEFGREPASYGGFGFGVFTRKYSLKSLLLTLSVSTEDLGSMNSNSHKDSLLSIQELKAGFLKTAVPEG